MRAGERVLLADILTDLMGRMILGLAARIQVSQIAITAVLWIVVKLWAAIAM